MRRYLEGAGWTCIAPTLFPEKRVKENPPPDLSNLSFQDYVDDMAARCQAIRDETGEAPAVIGHSMGGLIAQCLAEKGLVSKAVFLTPAQPKDCAKVSLSIAFTFANVILSQKRDKSYKIWKTGFNWGVLNCVPKSKHDEIYRLALYDSGRVYGDITDGVEIETRAIKIPTLTMIALRLPLPFVKSQRNTRRLRFLATLLSIRTMLIGSLMSPAPKKWRETSSTGSKVRITSPELRVR